MGRRALSLSKRFSLRYSMIDFCGRKVLQTHSESLCNDLAILQCPYMCRFIGHLCDVDL